MRHIRKTEKLRAQLESARLHSEPLHPDEARRDAVSTASMADSAESVTADHGKRTA